MLNTSALSTQEAEQAFEKHIREHELLIHKVCRMYAFTEADRQDLFQEIVLQLWRAFGRFKAESKFSTWLYRIALNTAISGLRKKRDFIHSREPSSLPAELSAEPYDPREDEQLRRLHLAIERLNGIEKAIVMLYMEDRSYEDMEDILGINQGNLRVKMSRIKDKLRQLTQNS